MKQTRRHKSEGSEPFTDGIKEAGDEDQTESVQEPLFRKHTGVQRERHTGKENKRMEKERNKMPTNPARHKE